jgi:DNA (cytosine-5)-methyltransferase 1
MSNKNNKIKTIELFAGVGGFRLGLEAAGEFDTIWSNQWEPSTKAQHASDIYVSKFGSNGHCNEDISKVIEERFSEIPDHDLLVGGFPCQDYSVARSLGQADGLKGKKGVLWWSIHDIIRKKGKKAPSYLMLENVDRLLKSPAKQRGRDFAVMLASLCDLGYAVEWRVINAADYGMPQKRHRVYIMAYKKDTPAYKKIKAMKEPSEWLTGEGIMDKAFPKRMESKSIHSFEIKGDLADISEDTATYGPAASPFQTVGIAINRKVWTFKGKAIYNSKKVKRLGDILLDEKDIPKEFFIDKTAMEKWKYMKGAKKEERTSANGHTYYYSEGPMTFPDALDKPSRTIVTGEGGTTPSRFKHVVQTPSGKLRRLTPVELERLNMFPDNHTAEASDAKRAFLMGNALVVGVVEKLGKALKENA